MSKYKYSGVDLTPEIFAELLLTLFEGKLFGREECIDAVKMYHVEHDGICEKKSYIPTFKRATLMLREKKYPITNVSYGKWRVENNCGVFKSYRDKLAKISCSVEQQPSEGVQKELGTGNETVYVYYYPTYKRYALSQGKDCWCCKVGKTTKKLWDRIYSQAGTCFPEEPFVELIFKCDDAHELEKTFHTILKLRHKWIETAPGTEWFITSPDEVLSIYESVI